MCPLPCPPRTRWPAAIARIVDRYVYPYSIMVNTKGERFADEGEDTRGRTYAKMGRAILAQPGGVAFQILDAKARKLNIYPTHYARATGAKAHTLEQLAKELDIRVDNFVRTVREFNAAIQTGEFNPDCYKLDGKCTRGLALNKSNYTLSIEEPPFEGWAVRYRAFMRRARWWADCGWATMPRAPA